MKLFTFAKSTAKPQPIRDENGRFLPGNAYRMVAETRSIDGIGYTRMIQPKSGKTVQYRKNLILGNSR